MKIYKNRKSKKLNEVAASRASYYSKYFIRIRTVGHFGAISHWASSSWHHFPLTGHLRFTPAPKQSCPVGHLLYVKITACRPCAVPLEQLPLRWMGKLMYGSLQALFNTWTWPSKYRMKLKAYLSSASPLRSSSRFSSWASSVDFPSFGEMNSCSKKAAE